MPRFLMPDNVTWIDAANYAAARQIYNAQNAPAVAPVVQGPVVAPPVTFTAVITPVDNFAGRSMTRFGVGEEIDLGFTTNPPGRTAASFGGLTWAIKSGNGTLVNSPGNVGTARLTMANMSGTVVLELRTVAMQPVTKLTKTLWVVEPSGAVMTNEPGAAHFHRQYTASAGFLGAIHLQPVDVSFYRCQWREGASTPVGTGSLAVSVSPLGATTQQELENLGSNVRHPVMGTWFDVLTGDSVLGCKVNCNDRVKSLTISPPYAVGTFYWDIPWLFRVKGNNPAEKTFFTARHEESVTATGQMTISKAGYQVVCNAADLNSTPPIPPW